MWQLALRDCDSEGLAAVAKASQIPTSNLFWRLASRVVPLLTNKRSFKLISRPPFFPHVHARSVYRGPWWNSSLLKSLADCKNNWAWPWILSEMSLFLIKWNSNETKCVFSVFHYRSVPKITNHWNWTSNNNPDDILKQFTWGISIWIFMI